MAILMYWLGLLGLLFFSATWAEPIKPEHVPEPLKPWLSWVTPERTELTCPFLYSDNQQQRCMWPSAVDLALTTKRGQFSFRVKAYKDSWITLPGDDQHWPLNVSVNQQTALVIDKDGLPMIKLLADKQAVDYLITGEFIWDKLPDNFALPSEIGLIKLHINGHDIASPTLREGQIWLKESEHAQATPDQQNNVALQVYRKITDDVPLELLTRLVFDVSGDQRELNLAKVLPDGFIPLALNSPLPAKLETDGRLLIQVRPGHWEIDINARSTHELSELMLVKQVTDNNEVPVVWPNSEIWVFDARPDLRVVEIENVSALDASQTTLPDEWKALPAYGIEQGQAMTFKLIRRGDPNPEPNQLNLARKLWLDFDGGGYTVSDTITGKLTSGWRLNALPETKLGKLALEGDNQLITREPGTNKQGVEVRKGLLNLTADSRINGDIQQIKAVGWEQTFQSVTAELNLPPGWRLLAATGVDNVPESWVSRWTLLDLFLVLIASLATSRIWSIAWGVMALVTLTLIWHEADAPHWLWLHILGATALLKVLPQQGGIRQWLSYYRYAVFLLLVIQALPFIVTQVRTGLYPQLEFGYDDDNVYTPAPAPMPATEPTMVGAANDMADKGSMPEDSAQQEAVQQGIVESDSAVPAKRRQYAERLAKQAYSAASPIASLKTERIDPSAHVQTGPGLPEWHWQTIELSWHGSVDAEQPLHLWYSPPLMTKLLNFLRVLCLVILAVHMFIGLTTYHWRRFWPGGTNLAILVLLLPLCLPFNHAYAADFPDEKLLNELKSRLQEKTPPDCLPSCAQIQQMHVSINETELNLALTIHAYETVYIPLPADAEQWLPNQVLANGKSETAMVKMDNSLWLQITPGAQQIQLRGPAPLLTKFTLPLPLKPKYTTLEASNWDVQGLRDNGIAETQLQFTRSRQVDNTAPTLTPSTIPSFVKIERQLELGLDWRVTTTVNRIAPSSGAILLSVPLLPGESVTSPGIHVKQNAVEVALSAQQESFSWQSVLEKTGELTLSAAKTDAWLEVWRADVSPIWHINTDGIAMMRLDHSEHWLPEWHPWPGETLTLHIARPEAVAGPTLTIEHSDLTVTPGQRIRTVELKFNVLSSQGGQHTIVLPEHARLQSVTINGDSHPIRQQDRKLSFPVTPGKQALALNWQEEDTPITTLLTTSDVDMGVASVNANIHVSLAEDRWVLFCFGPRLGPAVLFWGIFVVLLLIAYGFSKIRLTPLATWQWFLLWIGLSQIWLGLGALVCIWLILLGWRNRQTQTLPYFNAVQISLVVLTLISLGVLFSAVAQGLLSTPDMRITGNQSYASYLNWYQDLSDAHLPQATVISVPIMVYRLCMLAWSLWLAVALLNWLRWGWSCFSHEGLWLKKQPTPAKTAAEEKQDHG